jgi:hypothetical protein
MGDHGSRISAGESLAYLSKRDFVDNFSTLFSIKRGDNEPMTDFSMISVQQLLSLFFQNAHAHSKTAMDKTVVVPSSNSPNRNTVVAMPEFGRK